MSNALARRGDAVPPYPTLSESVWRKGINRSPKFEVEGIQTPKNDLGSHRSHLLAAVTAVLSPTTTRYLLKVVNGFRIPLISGCRSAHFLELPDPYSGTHYAEAYIAFQ